MAFHSAMSIVLLMQCSFCCAGKPPIGIQLCEEKSGVVQNAKATALAANMVDKCFLIIGSKYKYPPSMFQRGAIKMCLIFRFCYHKYKPVLNTRGVEAYGEAVYSCIGRLGPLFTVQLNPFNLAPANEVLMLKLIKAKDFVEAGAVNATGMFIDAVDCVSKNRIFTDDVAVSLALMKWILKTLF